MRTAQRFSINVLRVLLNNMLIIIAFSYLVRSGKLKSTTYFFKNTHRKVKLKIAKLELVILSGLQILRY
jgi:hypothetical protein